MTLMKDAVPANSVPAAAVIRGGRALFEMIGRKGHVDGFMSFHHYKVFYSLYKIIMECNIKKKNFLLYIDYTWEKYQGLTMVFPLYYKTRVSVRKVEFLEERLNFMIPGGRPKA